MNVWQILLAFMCFWVAYLTVKLIAVEKKYARFYDRIEGAKKNFFDRSKTSAFPDARLAFGLACKILSKAMEKIR